MPQARVGSHVTAQHVPRRVLACLACPSLWCVLRAYVLWQVTVRCCVDCKRDGVPTRFSCAEYVQEADAEPLLVADCGLVLEATLGVDDLDGLIARLRAGVVDLGPGPPPDSPAGANATAGVGGTGGVSDAQAAAAGRGWFTDLPAADTLWSDEEEDQVSAARLVLQDKALGVPSSAPEIGAAAASRAPEGISSVSSGIRRDAPIAAAGTITSAPTVAMPELPGQTISAPGGLTGKAATSMTATAVAAAASVALFSRKGRAPPYRYCNANTRNLTSHDPSKACTNPAGPLPAKFKFFAGPTPALGQPGGLAPPRQAGSDSSSGTGPVKVDLRASIADVVEQRHKETAAAAAERVSREKASAAARRLRGSSDGDSDDDEGGEPAQPKQRPVRGLWGAALGVRPVLAFAGFMPAQFVLSAFLVARTP